MTLPGPTVTIRDDAPPAAAPTGTARWFVAGITEQGPLTPQRITSLTDYVDTYGERVTYGYLYDALDAYFREGGGEAYVVRVVGADAVNATVELLDQSGSTSPGDVALIATAVNPGAWANELNVVVDYDAGSFTITVTHDTDGTLETSGALADRDAAVAWAESSEYITLALGASAEDPRDGTYSLASGDDDRSSIVDADWADALDLFESDLGGGQVSMPGRTTAQAHTDTLAHAAATHRTALLDGADTATVSTLTTLAGTLRDLDDNARFGGLFAPWATIAGLTAGTTRTIPYSAIQAGMIARNDNAGGNPNVAAAGAMGVSSVALDVTQEWTAAERETLHDAGVNVARVVYSQVRTYGYRTLTDPDEDPNWIQLSGTRMVMAIRADAEAIAEQFAFAEIDGRGHTISAFHGALSAMLGGYHAQGALYGDTPADAFLVDTGIEVNTLETIAAGQLRAVIAARVSPHAEQTLIEIVKQPTDEALAA